MTTTIGIWHIIGWSVGALAALTLIVALLGDAVRRRFRRVRRCPRCWYDLSHTPGMTCSECGYTARRERQLFKSRRRKRWVLGAVLLWIASYFAFRVPDMQQRGWVAAVPTTALLVTWPQWQVPWLDAWFMATRDVASRSPYPQTATTRLAYEFSRRLDADALYDWQWTIAIETAIRTAGRQRKWRDAMDEQTLHVLVLRRAALLGYLDDSGLLYRALHSRTAQFATRSRWPVGIAVRACVFGQWDDPEHGSLDLKVRAEPLSPGLARISEDDLRYSHSSRLHSQAGVITNGIFVPVLWQDGTVQLGYPADIGAPMRYDVHVHQILLDDPWRRSAGPLEVDYSNVVSVCCTLAGTLDDYLIPVKYPAFDQVLVDQLRPSLEEGHLCFPLNEVAGAFALLEGATFAVTLEVMLNDAVLATGEAWWVLDIDPFSRKPAIGPRYECVRLTTSDGAEPQFDSQQAGYRLRVRPNPLMALRRFDGDRYWSGEIDVPLTFSECGQRK